MIAHLKNRATALAALGWTGHDAEWLAFVCLHSGVFLRSQYLTFTGESHPMHASRFIARCGPIAVEEPWNGTALRICRIVARPVYRALGAEHIRHRREASAAHSKEGRMGLFTRATPATAGDHTGEDIARRLREGTLPAVDVDTREAFEDAIVVMLRTGQPLTVPAAAALDAWCGPVDELPDDELEAEGEVDG